MTPEFLLTALIVCLIPGTGVVYTLAVGLGRGFLPALAAAFGCTLGIVPHAAASIAGLAAILHASALAFQIVKFAGIAYLMWMAWGMLRAGGGALKIEQDLHPAGAFRLVRDGVALNLLNPKLSVFFLAFLPQFVPAGAAATPALIALAGAFMALTFATFALYGAAASLARDYVLARPRVMAWLNRSFAAAFAALGLRLALAER